RRSPRVVVSQSRWSDSWEEILFPDERLARRPSHGTGFDSHPWEVEASFVASTHRVQTRALLSRAAAGHFKTNGSSRLPPACPPTTRAELSSSTYFTGKRGRIARGLLLSAGSMRTLYWPGAAPSPGTRVVSENAPSGRISPDAWGSRPS